MYDCRFTYYFGKEKELLFPSYDLKSLPLTLGTYFTLSLLSSFFKTVVFLLSEDKPEQQLPG